MPHDLEADRSVQRRTLDAHSSSAHELMLALMDFAAAQASEPNSSIARPEDCGLCQTCAHETRHCVLGFYIKGLHSGNDDETEIVRLRRQGCLVQVVEVERLEAFAPNLLSAVRRVKAQDE